MLFLYTVPGTEKPTITSCLPHHLQPETVIRPDQRHFAYLDLIYDSCLQLLNSSSSASDRFVFQIATAVATCCLILVLFMLKIHGFLRRKTTCVNLSRPPKSSSAPSRSNASSTKPKVPVAPPVTAVSSTLLSAPPSTSRPRYKRPTVNPACDIQSDFVVVRILPSPFEALSPEAAAAARAAIQNAVAEALSRAFSSPSQITRSSRSPNRRSSASRISQGFGEVAATVHRSASLPDVQSGVDDECDGNGNQKDKLFATIEVRLVFDE